MCVIQNNCKTLNSKLVLKHDRLRNMTQFGFNKIILTVKGYVMENWGSPFIVGFMFLLIAAAVSLFAGFSSLADAVAVYAFYALVAGVFLQLASFLKYRGKSDGAEVAV